MTQSDAHVLAAKPHSGAAAAAEGYDSDVTRDDAPHALAALRQPSTAPNKAAAAAAAAAVASSPPAVATALPATRRSARTHTQKADAMDITAQLQTTCLQTTEPAAGGKAKRGAVVVTQQESQGALLHPFAACTCAVLTCTARRAIAAKRPRKMSAPAQPIRQRTAAPVDLFSAR